MKVNYTTATLLQLCTFHEHLASLVNGINVWNGMHVWHPLTSVKEWGQNLLCDPIPYSLSIQMEHTFLTISHKYRLLLFTRTPIVINKICKQSVL